jgi:hypothetical protein
MRACCSFGGSCPTQSPAGRRLPTPLPPSRALNLGPTWAQRLRQLCTSARLGTRSDLRATLSLSPLRISRRSGGQGVASSNLASPTVFGLVRGMARARRGLDRVPFHENSHNLGDGSTEPAGRGPRALLGEPHIRGQVRVTQRSRGIFQPWTKPSSRKVHPQVRVPQSSEPAWW